MLYSQRPKTERWVWQTEQKIVRFEIVRLVPNVCNRNKTGFKSVWNRFCVRKPNEIVRFCSYFRQCLKSERFGNQTKPVLSKIWMFGFWTSTVILNNVVVSQVLKSESFSLDFRQMSEIWTPEKWTFVRCPESGKVQISDTCCNFFWACNSPKSTKFSLLSRV